MAAMRFAREHELLAAVRCGTTPPTSEVASNTRRRRHRHLYDRHTAIRTSARPAWRSVCRTGSPTSNSSSRNRWADAGSEFAASAKEYAKIFASGRARVHQLAIGVSPTLNAQAIAVSLVFNATILGLKTSATPGMANTLSKSRLSVGINGPTNPVRSLRCSGDN
jgi:hypothetical protein